MDSLETKEEEEDSQVVEKTAIERDEQAGWGVGEIITGALEYVHTEVAGCNCSQSEITI